MSSFHEEYRKLLALLHNSTLEETNSRTGVKIRMLEGGYSFKIGFYDCKIPVGGNRKYFPHIAAAEVAWQFLGTQNPSFIIAKAPKIWVKFVRNGKLETAYGYRWRHHFGRDQIKMAIHELKHNPTNRQLYVSAWDPAKDGLGAIGQPPNIPCPVGFSLTCVDKELHCSMFLRSSDVFVGLPYDIMGYALLVDSIAASCDLIPGTLHVTLAHAHVYEPHFEALEHSLHNEWLSAEPALPAWSVQEIEEDPDGYVEKVKRLAGRVPWTEWNPMPEVIV